MAVPGKAAEQVRVLTLDEALQITLEHNRDIQKAVENKKKIMGFYVEQRAAALPQLTATGTGARSWDEAQARAQSIGPFTFGPITIPAYLIPPNVDQRAVGVGLTQPLFTWGQVGAAIKAAKFGLASADDQLRVFRQAALRDVSAAFYDVLLAKEAYSIALQNLRQKEAHADEARRRFSAGVSTEYDVLAREVAVDNALPDAIRTENLVRTSRDSSVSFSAFLRRWTREDPRDPVEGPPGYEETLEIAYRRRPELTDLKNRLGLASELVKVAQGGQQAAPRPEGLRRIQGADAGPHRVRGQDMVRGSWP